MTVLEKRAFILRLDTAGAADRYNEAIRTNTVGIGWQKLDGLCAPMDWDALKRQVDDKYPHYGGNSRKIGGVAGSVWRFAYEMTEGSLVVVPLDRHFAVARITGPVEDHADTPVDDFRWRRSVEWLTSGNHVPRDRALNELLKRLKIRQTVAWANDLYEEILAAKDRQKPVSFADKIEDDVVGAVLASLRSAGGDSKLEELVKQLVEAGGASAQVLPKKGADGDVDVDAIYSLFPIALNTEWAGADEADASEISPELRIGFQVKQHYGQTDAHAIQQLLDRNKHNTDIGQPYDRLVAITTADDFSVEAKKLAFANRVLLVSGPDFARWVLASGLSNIRAQSVD